MNGAKELLLSLQNVAEDLENRSFLGGCFQNRTTFIWTFEGNTSLSVCWVLNLVNNNHNKNAYCFWCGSLLIFLLIPFQILWVPQPQSLRGTGPNESTERILEYVIFESEQRTASSEQWTVLFWNKSRMRWSIRVKFLTSYFNTIFEWHYCSLAPIIKTICHLPHYITIGEAILPIVTGIFDKYEVGDVIFVAELIRNWMKMITMPKIGHL